MMKVRVLIMMVMVMVVLVMMNAIFFFYKHVIVFLLYKMISRILMVMDVVQDN